MGRGEEEKMEEGGGGELERRKKEKRKGGGGGGAPRMLSGRKVANSRIPPTRSLHLAASGEHQPHCFIPEVVLAWHVP